MEVINVPWSLISDNDDTLYCSCCAAGEAHAGHLHEDSIDTLDTSLHGERE